MERRRRERRPPATLRTRTGCTNCRARHRKCDERHPTCIACSKRNLECSWLPKPIQTAHRERSCTEPGGYSGIKKFSSAATVSTNSKPSDVLNPPFSRYTYLAPSYLPPLTLGVDRELLNHYSSKLCFGLLRNGCHPAFRDYFLMSSILPRLQLMADPLLACASFDLSKHIPKYRSIAMKYYSQAVTMIHEKIAQKSVQGTEDWLLLNVLHLNLFETWNATTTTPSLHIQGAAQMLKLRGTASSGSNSISLQSTGDKVFARIAAEAFVYHAASWSIFNGNPISMPANELWDFVEPYLTIRPFPTASDAENSPVLGVPWQLYGFLLDLSQLTHRLPLSSSDYRAAYTVQAELDAWIAGGMAALETPIEVDTPTPTSRYQQSVRLFVLALWILLSKLMHLETSSFDATIQAYVSEALELIQLRVTERFFFWPLLIVGSAVTRRDQADIIDCTLKDMSKTMHSGTFLKTTRILETIWDTTTAECTIRTDGLDLLLGRNGVPGLLNG